MSTHTETNQHTVSQKWAAVCFGFISIEIHTKIRISFTAQFTAKIISTWKFKKKIICVKESETSTGRTPYSIRSLVQIVAYNNTIRVASMITDIDRLTIRMVWLAPFKTFNKVTSFAICAALHPCRMYLELADKKIMHLTHCGNRY